jgi:hypothetical protein
MLVQEPHGIQKIEQLHYQGSMQSPVGLLGRIEQMFTTMAVKCVLQHRMLEGLESCLVKLLASRL